jgi:hypothetical protein
MELDYFVMRYAIIGVLALIFGVLAILSIRAMNAAGNEEQFRNAWRTTKMFEGLTLFALIVISLLYWMQHSF